MNFERLKSGDKSIEVTILSGIKKSVIALTLMLMGFNISANAADYIVDKGVSSVKWHYCNCKWIYLGRQSKHYWRNLGN